MKKRFTGILAMLLCAALLMGMVPVTAFAEEFGPQTPIQLETVYHVNPEYADVIEESDLYHPAQTDDLTDLQTDKVNYEDYTSVEEAALILREQMKNRVAEVTVLVKVAATATDTWGDIFNLAIEHTGNPKEGDYIFRHYGGWTGDGYYYDEGDYHYMHLTYSLKYHTTAEQEIQVDAAVQTLLNQLNVYEATDYEKVKAIYDWICYNVTYDYDTLEDDTYKLKYSAYAALFNGTAVCQGYAVLFYRLALELGVDARYIRGYSSGDYHGWNIVELDEEYYNLDTTWDADNAVAGRAYDYFLKSMDNFPDHTRRDEYLTDEFHATYPMSTMNYEDAVREVASGTFGNGLSWKLIGKGTLTISGTGTMPEYGNAGLAPWDSYAADINALVIEDGVQSIGTYAFAYCSNVTKVTFLGAAPEIGYNAFTNVTATVHYPGLNPTWTAEKLSGYGGSLTWVADIEGADGWIQSGGSWYYLSGGVKYTGWLKQNENWYYLDASGIMSVGWEKINGAWYYFDANGIMQTGWVQIGGAWFYIADSGIMQTGWMKQNDVWFYFGDDGTMAVGWEAINGTWYYFNNSGHMQTGWQEIGGQWFFLGTDGILRTGWLKQGNTWFYLASDGHMQTGWAQINGAWYYFDTTGHLQTGWEQIGGAWYYFDANGAMQIGWLKQGSTWFYLASDGHMQTGWLQLGSDWYYFDASGHMQTGWLQLGGKWYCFDTDGSMMTGWQKNNGVWYFLTVNGHATSCWQQSGGEWYYINEDGQMHTGWLESGDTWYYFGSDGTMQTGWVQISGKWYYFNDDMQTGWIRVGSDWYYCGYDGVMKTGWMSVDGAWYYFGTDGVMQTGWVKLNGNWYYFDDYMLTGWQKIDRSWYYFDSNGAMHTGWLEVGSDWYYLAADGTMVTGAYVISGVTYYFDSNGIWIP